ncbi:B-cell differentiation antigen CD72-like [Pelobates fuscus]|uniref:B-cell differentiation antigen CD72-like n=1 Tax=Pelobates fuscus TaxID=191477 RepID=UPI002FE48A87
MAESITYADLQFIKLPLKQSQNADENSEKWEDMYENVNCPKLEKQVVDFQASPNGSSRQLRTGIHKRVFHLALVFFFIFFTTTIGLMVKYISVSRELHRLSLEYVMMNTSLSQTLQSQDDSLENKKQSLAQSQHQVEQLGQDLADTNHSLQRCHEDTEQYKRELQRITILQNKTSQDIRKTQQTLENAISQLNKIEKDSCPEGWILFNTKCLFISENKDNWFNSFRQCELKQSSLLVLRDHDADLKTFLTSKQTSFWVGKDAVKTPTGLEWTWPNEYQIYDYTMRGLFQDGRLGRDHYYSQHKWICERNLIALEVYDTHYKEFQSSITFRGVRMKCVY